MMKDTGDKLHLGRWGEIRQMLVILPLMVLLLLFGCASPPAEKEDTFFQDWKAKVETSRPVVPTVPKKLSSRDPDKQSPPKRRSPLPAPVVKANQVDPEKLPDTKVSITFVDAELGTVLRALGRIADQNIIINPSVKGLVNTHIIDTPWNDVFMSIVHTYGLLLSKEGNLLRVQSMEALKNQVEREALLLEQTQLSPLVNRIVPIEFSISKSYRFAGWDRKYVPVPFSKVIIKYGDPIYVTAENFEEMEVYVKEVMIPK